MRRKTAYFIEIEAAPFTGGAVFYSRNKFIAVINTPCGIIRIEVKGKLYSEHMNTCKN